MFWDLNHDGGQNEERLRDLWGWSEMATWRKWFRNLIVNAFKTDWQVAMKTVAVHSRHRLGQSQAADESTLSASQEGSGSAQSLPCYWDPRLLWVRLGLPACPEYDWTSFLKLSLPYSKNLRSLGDNTRSGETAAFWGCRELEHLVNEPRSLHSYLNGNYVYQKSVNQKLKNEVNGLQWS